LRDDARNQVIRLAFTSGLMRSGRYGVLSESPALSPLGQISLSPRTVSRSVRPQLPRRDLSSPRTKASVFDFLVSSGSARTSLWNKQALRTSWLACIGNSRDGVRAVEALTTATLSIHRSLTLRRTMTGRRMNLIEQGGNFQFTHHIEFLGSLPVID
jgi:hypothetical protein